MNQCLTINKSLALLSYFLLTLMKRVLDLKNDNATLSFMKQITLYYKLKGVLILYYN